ncbi:MAG: S8 family peptidase [Lewinellaceae bacterium]|nr:S8 family peptidase [Lewinellaceae bacterium]
MKILFTCLFALGTFWLWGQAGSTPLQKEGEWILMLSPGTDVPALDPAIPVRPLSVEAGAYLLRFPRERKAAILEELSHLPGFLAIQPNFYLSPRSVEPNDPYFESQWNMTRIQAPEAWAFTTGGHTALGDPIVVAVMDDGFDLDHPDLSGNLWVNEAEMQGTPGLDDDMNGKTDDIQGWNFDSDSKNLPIKPHGTSVLGIIGASGNNGTGVAGVNWNVRILPMVVRTIGDMIEGYEYAWKFRKKYNETGGAQGAMVVATSASLGFDQVFCSEFPALNAILDSLGHAGVLSVAATANGDWNVDEVGDIPTSCASEFLIAVTNADLNDEKYQFAAFGAESIDLGAPGGSPDQGSFTTAPPGGYDESFGGTSAACPHVSGAVALLYSIPDTFFAQQVREDPVETARLIKKAILEGVDSLQAFQGITGSGGRLNLYRSILYLHGFYQPIPLSDPLQYTDRRRLIRVFPNPLPSGVPVQILYGSRDLAPVTVRLFNNLGQLVQQYTHTPVAFSDQLISLPTTNLEAGMYWVVLENGISPISFKILIF